MVPEEPFAACFLYRLVARIQTTGCSVTFVPSELWCPGHQINTNIGRQSFPNPNHGDHHGFNFKFPNFPQTQLTCFHPVYQKIPNLDQRNFKEHEYCSCWHRATSRSRADRPSELSRLSQRLQHMANTAGQSGCTRTTISIQLHDQCNKR